MEFKTSSQTNDDATMTVLEYKPTLAETVEFTQASQRQTSTVANNSFLLHRRFKARITNGFILLGNMLLYTFL